MRRLLSAGLTVLALSCAQGVAAADGHSFTVVCYNIHHARGVDGKVDVARIADVIKTAKADLVALQEVDRGVERTDHIDIPGELEKLTGLHAVFEKNIDFQGGEYGNAILSRFPVVESSNLRYQMIRENEQRGLLQAVVDIDGRKLIFAATHLDYRPDNSERLLNAEEIIALRNASGETPVIVCGDFNDFPDKQLHRKLTSTFTDAWEVAGKGNGFTYPSTGPQRRIDYVFFTRPDLLTVQHASVIQSDTSDHLPLVVTFELKLSRND